MFVAKRHVHSITGEPLYMNSLNRKTICPDSAFLIRREASIYMRHNNTTLRFITRNDGRPDRKDYDKSSCFNNKAPIIETDKISIYFIYPEQK